MPGLRPLILSVLAGLALYLVFLALSGYQDTLAAIARLDGWHWLLIVGLSLVNYAVRFGRWHQYLAALGHTIPGGRHILYYLAGFALTTTPGKAGETIRSIYLKNHGVSYTHSLAAFFAERLMDLLAMVGLALLAVSYLEGYRWTVFVAAALVIAVLPVVHSKALSSTLLAWGHKQGRSAKLSAGMERLVSLLESASALLRSRILYSGFVLGVLAWGAEGTAFYYILSFLGVELAPTVCIGIYAISVLAGALSFIPGGLGSTEAVMGLLLVLLGVSHQEAVAATLICRVATLWFAVGVGLLAMALLHVRKSAVADSVS